MKKHTDFHSHSFQLLNVKKHTDFHSHSFHRSLGNVSLCQHTYTPVGLCCLQSESRNANSMSLPALCEHVKYPPPPSLTITAKSERTQSDIWLNKGPISPSVLAKVIEEHICLKPKISMVYRSIAHRRLGSSIEQGFGEPFEPRFCFSC